MHQFSFKVVYIETTIVVIIFFIESRQTRVYELIGYFPQS